MVTSLAGGGPNDLLGYLSTDAYWKAKNVHPTLQQLTADLAPTQVADVSKLIADLSAADPAVREQAGKKIVALGPGALPQLDDAAKDPSDPETATRSRALAAQIRTEAKALSVRRLMAIRTLGELKNRDALPALQKLLESTQMFDADYARSAIAAIEGKDVPISLHVPADRMKDVSLLAAKTDMVCQLVPTGGPALPLEKMFDKLLANSPGADPAKAMEQMYPNVMNLADAIGNVRLDAITLGWYMAPTGKPGNAVIVARGQFDSSAVIAALKANQAQIKMFGNSEAYMLDETTALLFPSEGMAVMVAAEKDGELPMDETLAALSKGSGTFSTNKDLNKQIAGIDTKRPFWMVTRVNDLRDMFDFLGAFDTVTMMAGPQPGAKQPTLAVQLAAVGPDEMAVKAAIDTAQKELKQTIDQGAAQAQALPLLQPIIDMARSVKLQSHGKDAAATADVTLDAVLPVVLINQIGPPGQR
jgi:hypothetical protein